MTDHPSTYSADDTHREGIQWDDRAAVHRKGDGQGILDGAKALNRGTFAEMVRLVSRMAEDERGDYVIQKAGDRKFEAAEIMALAEKLPPET